MIKIKNKFRYFILLIFILFLQGCATTGPYKEFTNDVSILRVGMAQGEVRNLLGEPDSTGNFLNERLHKVFWSWDYRKTSSFWQDIHLTVYFSDKNGTVVDWEEWSPALSL